MTKQSRNAGGWLGLIGRVVLGWSLFVVALLSAVSVGELVETRLGAATLVRQSVQALVLSGLVVPGILFLRQAGDKRPIRSLGLTSMVSGWRAFLFGTGLVLVLAGSALAFGVLTGELQIVKLSFSATLLLALLTEIAVAFFYEALPEELTFRGYLYSVLNTRVARWLALLAQVGLFVLASVTAAALQQGFGQDVQLGGANRVTLDYLILLTGFGLVLQLCRLVTGSLWASIGFHLTFLTLNPSVIGPGEDALVRVAETRPQSCAGVGSGMPTCPYCSGTKTHKDGRDRARKQRYCCSACGRSFTDRTGTPFENHRWPRDVIIMAVRWYFSYRLSAANVRNLLAERGLDVSRQTVADWVQKFGVLLAEAGRRYAKRVSSRWFVDETYVRVGKTWAYLYRAVDEAGQVVDVLLREKRDLESAKTFFVQAIKRRGVVPDEVVTDKHRAYLRAVKQHAPNAKHRRTGLHRKWALTTKPIERSHVPIKDRVRPMRSLSSVTTGQHLLEGVEVAQAVWRGDIRPPGQSDPGSVHEYVRLAVATFSWLASGLRTAA